MQNHHALTIVTFWLSKSILFCMFRYDPGSCLRTGLKVIMPYSHKHMCGEKVLYVLRMAMCLHSAMWYCMQMVRKENMRHQLWFCALLQSGSRCLIMLIEGVTPHNLKQQSSLRRWCGTTETTHEHLSCTYSCIVVRFFIHKSLDLHDSFGSN